MNGKRVLLALIPVLAFSALIGGGLATWYFSTDSEANFKADLTVSDGCEIGTIDVLNADDIYLSLDQTVHELSAPLQVQFTPDDKVVDQTSDVAPSISLFNFTYNLVIGDGAADEEAFRYYLDFENNGTWNNGSFSKVAQTDGTSKWIYVADIDPTFTLINVFTNINQFNEVKDAVIKPLHFTLNATLA